MTETERVLFPRTIPSSGGGPVPLHEAAEIVAGGLGVTCLYMDAKGKRGGNSGEVHVRGDEAARLLGKPHDPEAVYLSYALPSRHTPDDASEFSRLIAYAVTVARRARQEIRKAREAPAS